LCFCDREGGPKIKGESDLRFYPGSGTLPLTAVISKIALHGKTLSNRATYREWNFTKPQLDLQISKTEPDRAKAPTPKGMDLEQYHFPHLYELQKTGNRYGDLQLLRQLAFSRSIECESDVARFLPASTYSMGATAVVAVPGIKSGYSSAVICASLMIPLVFILLLVVVVILLVVVIVAVTAGQSSGDKREAERSVLTNPPPDDAFRPGPGGRA
jgi:hypothetical protein